MEITGHVTLVNISGMDYPTSAEIEFVIQNENEQKSMGVTSTPVYQPHVFVSMANLLIDAYYSKSLLDVSYETNALGFHFPLTLRTSTG